MWKQDLCAVGFRVLLVAGGGALKTSGTFLKVPTIRIAVFWCV